MGKASAVMRALQYLAGHETRIVEKSKALGFINSFWKACLFGVALYGVAHFGVDLFGANFTKIFFFAFFFKFVNKIKKFFSVFLSVFFFFKNGQKIFCLFLINFFPLHIKNTSSNTPLLFF